jgi:hypothetical protein
MARTLPVLTPRNHGMARIDWVCVPTSEARSVREACVEREAAKERLRETFRKAAADAVREMGEGR